MVDTTVLLSLLICPLLFPQIYFGSSGISMILPTPCQPFCLAISGKIISIPPQHPNSPIVFVPVPPNTFQCDYMHWKSYGDTLLYLFLSDASLLGEVVRRNCAKKLSVNGT